MRPFNANDKATVAINCNKNKSDAAAHGRRTNLEAWRLLGVEAQDAGLRCRPPPSARSPRRALALLERAAAGPSRRRGPLRRVGLIAGHPSYAIGASTGQLCVQHKANESRRQRAISHCTRTIKRGVEASSANHRTAGRRGRSQGTDPTSPALSGTSCCRRGGHLALLQAHCLVPALENRRRSTYQLSLQRPVENSCAPAPCSSETLHIKTG